MSEGLMLYPSGFLGSPLVEPTPPLPEGVANRTFEWVAAVKQPNLMPGAKAVEELFAAVLAGDPVVNTFEFREKILIAAKRTFGFSVAADWFNAQRKSPNYCDYHARWLEETVQFVLLGKPREYTYNVWFGLLDAAASPLSGLKNQLHVTMFAVGGPYRNMAMTSFIEQWVQRPRGILDLLESMHVLFGVR